MPIKTWKKYQIWEAISRNLLDLEGWYFTKIKDNYVYFVSFSYHFGVNRTVFKFEMNFWKVTIFWAKSTKNRVFWNVSSRKLLMLKHSSFIFISQNVIHFFLSIYLFSVKMHIRARIHAYVIIGTFLEKNCPGSGPKFLSQNQMIYKWPKMKHLSENK